MPAPTFAQSDVNAEKSWGHLMRILSSEVPKRLKAGQASRRRLQALRRGR